MASLSGGGLAPLQSPTSRSVSAYSYSGFRLPSSSSSASSDGGGGDGDDDSDIGEPELPFPAALARKDFLAPDFDAVAYLSSLFPSATEPTAAHRHQTLEDLRAELRERSSAISAELLELVNANYTSFLGLGNELKGGEERVEDVRVALLGFRRAVEDVQARVRARRTEVTALSGELADVRLGVELGRRMLELDERVGLLEGRLALGMPKGPKGGSDAVDPIFGSGVDDSEDEDEEEEDDDKGQHGQNGHGHLGGSASHAGFAASSPAKLLSLAREFVLVEHLADAIGLDLPYVRKMEERIIRCRNTILLDLSTAVKEARKAGAAGHARILKFLAVYRLLDAGAEAVRVLKEK